MYCPNCGSNTGSANFCVNCGAKVEAPEHEVENSREAPAPRVKASYPREPAQPVYQHYAPPPPQPTIVNVHNTATAISGRTPRRRSCLFDFIMIIITGGFWIIWMIFRPKYY